MAVPLPARRGVSVRTARRDERLQSTASPLVQRADTDGEENHAADLAFERASAREGRSLFPPYGRHQLSADGRLFGAASARLDRASQSRVVPVYTDRPAG